MPVTTTYPGVYVEEIPSGVRTIVGVATSITAFIGRTRRGPVNEPITINSFGDFERTFGALGEKYPVSYAVRDFYLNGGSQAIVVRLYHATFADEDGQKKAQVAAQAVADAATGVDAAAAAGAARTKVAAFPNEPEKSAADAVAKEAEARAKIAGAKPEDVQAAAKAAVNSAAPRNKARLTIGDIVLEAASEGTWGNNLRARVEGTVPKEVTDRFKLQEGEMFNLVVQDTDSGATERFLNVSVKPSVRQLDRVLKDESSLVRVVGDLPQQTPAPSDAQLVKDAEGSDKTKSDAAKEELKKSPFKSDQRSVEVADTDKASIGTDLTAADYKGSEESKTGLHALDNTDLFNLLCIPPDPRDGDTPTDVYQDAMEYCADRRAFLIVDPPADWGKRKETAAAKARDGLDKLGLSGLSARNAAIFFPRVLQFDPERGGQLDTFVPCGIVAGVMARTDVERGVWKAPAGIDAAMNGIQGLEVNLNDAENGMLNPLGINCLRAFPVFGRVVWGARTLRGADQLGDEYKYIPVRRTALFLEESLFRGLKFAVFEPNDEPLWAQIRLNVGAFMQNLFRQGAFQGKTPREAYFVKCDKETTTQNDINLGIVNVVVGFAPLKPAEFVIIKLQQMAGQIDV
jgi:phage tail sheath protein FI